MRLDRILRRARNVAHKAPKPRRVTRVSIEHDWTIVGSTDLQVWYDAEVRWPHVLWSDRLFVADASALAKYKGRLNDAPSVSTELYTPAPADTVTHSMAVPLPALARVRHAMGRDPLRPTRGVWVESGHLVATDGHRLAVSDVETVEFEPARLPIRLVDLACDMFEGLGEITIERGERTIRIRCGCESLTARIALDDRYAPWRPVFPATIEARCEANRETLADAATRVSNTTDDGRVRLRVGSPLLVFDRGPDHDVEYRVKSKSVEGEGAEISVSGVYLAEAIEGLACKNVEVLLGQDSALETAIAEYEEVKKSGRLFIPELHERKIKDLRKRDPVLVELRARPWRALIMAMRT